MKFPVIELVDRYAIAVVKSIKTNHANAEEIEFYSKQLEETGISNLHPLIQELIKHHEYVWSLEDDFKKGRIDEKPLEEIGRIALAVRDQGHERVRIKNALAELLNDPVREIKNYANN
jgi:hypothetical protein